MERFFVKEDDIDHSSNTITIKGSDVNHIANVLRHRVGDELWISDGNKKEYRCRIKTISDESILLEIEYEAIPEYELPVNITLYQGLPKGDKMDLIVQKAVELGVNQIVPVEMARSVVKLDEKKGQKKAERWQEIARASAKQSKRLKVPTVYSPISFKEAMILASTYDVILLPYELAKGMKSSRHIIENIPLDAKIGIFIGPEGGFDPKEVQELENKGAKIISLGKRILRTETAGLTLLSILMFSIEARKEN